MGGKALSIQTERISIEKYEQISYEIVGYFSKEYSNKNCYFMIPNHIGNKESFGDLDVIMCYKDNNENLNIKYEVKQFIKNKFNSQSIVVNHNVISFDYQNFQIDIIIVKENEGQSTFTYMCYGDASNIIGRIAHRFGLKFGMDGFFFKYKGYEKLLTRNLKDAMIILGFDSKKFFEGFNSNLELFEWIKESKYFDPYIFKSNNDDMKRSIYSQFLDYIKDFDFSMPHFRFRKNPEEYIGLISTWYPQIIEFTFEIDSMLEERKLVANKFNGNLIMQKYPDLSGIKLGKVISMFHQYISHTKLQTFNEYIIKNEDNVIWNDFENVYHNNLLQLNN